MRQGTDLYYFMQNIKKKKTCRLYHLSFSLFFISIFFQVGFSAELIVAFNQPITLSHGNAAIPTDKINNRTVRNILRQNVITEIRQLAHTNAAKLPGSLQNVFIISLPDSRTAEVSEALLRLPEVIYLQPNYRRKIHLMQSDPLLGSQWYLQSVEAVQAWSMTTGNQSIIVGIIDTGIDYNHQDLRVNLWINAVEDLNQNGTLDSSDLNGIDDDLNGYIDDVWGWDFTDAPAFPDNGDFRDPDNDPMDEFGSNGHGTSVAGLIAAVQNNNVGISGIAPKVKIMNLRAGNASGFLEEDDVAEAIIYAVDNGCKIVNMSFGDVAYSYLLRDAISYGVSRGVIFVASAGNSASSMPNYPAAFTETISVSATDSSNSLAPFSNYGNTISIAAPGSQVLSTFMGNRYGKVSGTSFSAPIVSAVLALCCSANPSLPSEYISGAVFSTAKDLGFSGWDQFYGHGLVNAFGALRIGSGGFASITFPLNNTGISGNTVAIIGSAFSPSLKGYTLSYAVGESGNNMQQIAQILNRQVINDTLAFWQTDALDDSVYTLELRVHQHDLPDIVSRNRITIDRTPPQLLAIEISSILHKADGSALIRIKTDDYTTATLQYHHDGAGKSDSTAFSPYLAQYHSFIVDPENRSGNYRFQILLKNVAGLSTIADNNGTLYSFNLQKISFSPDYLTPREILPAKGFLLPKAIDLNTNQKPDIVFTTLSDEKKFGVITTGEWQDSTWQITTLHSRPMLPRDAGAIFPGSGVNILAGFGDRGFVLGNNSPDVYPNNIVLADSVGFWVSQLKNFDGDEDLELFAHKSGSWTIYDIQNNFQLQEKQILETSTPSPIGVPVTLSGDFDGDTLQEIIWDDIDGNLYIYETTSIGFFQPSWQTKMTGKGGNGLLAYGDLDGDGTLEWISVARHVPAVQSESTVNDAFWELIVWRSSGNNEYSPIAIQRILGVNTASGQFNGITCGDIDGNEKVEIVFTPFPHAYIFSLENDSLTLQWFRDDINSNAAVVSDVDQNGKVDVLLNSFEGIAHFENNSTPQAPPTPSGFAAVPIDTNLVALSWHIIPEVAYYKIYRTILDNNNLTLIDSTSASFYMDSTVIRDSLYFYAITAVNHQFPIAESPFSRIVSARPNLPPTVDSIVVNGVNSLTVFFSEPLNDAAFKPAHYLLNHRSLPITAIRKANRLAVLLTFEEPFPEGTNILQIIDIRDVEGTPPREDTLQKAFSVPPVASPFYLRSAEVVSKTLIKLQFSESVDTLTAVDITNYAIQPDVRIEHIEVAPENPATVWLHLDSHNLLGAKGIVYQLQIKSLRSSKGTPLSDKNVFNLLKPANDLDEVTAFPNPYRVSFNQPLRIANLPAGSNVWIYSANGTLIREFRDAVVHGVVEWDLRNQQGKEVSAGVYVYVVKWRNNIRRGKLLIIK